MTIRIELVNPSSGSCSAGEFVDGLVVINYTAPKDVKEVTILLEGGCRVRWREMEANAIHPTQDRQPFAPRPTLQERAQQERDRQREMTLVTYFAEETYISQKLSLFGDGENYSEIPEGTTTYPFRFALPSNLPSSFSSLHGHITYSLNAEVQRPLLVPNDRASLPLTVIGIFDLNSEAGAKLPQTYKKLQGPNFCACRDGDLSFVVRLPKRSGFIPGELVDLQAEITNGTNQKVYRTSALLHQITTFHAQGKSKILHKIVGGARGPDVEEGEYELWTPDNFKVPPVPPTRLGGTCRLIDLQYTIMFELKISGLSSSLYGQLPIMIGTVPLGATSGESRSTSVKSIPELEISPPQDDPAPGAGATDNESEKYESNSTRKKSDDSTNEKSEDSSVSVFATRASAMSVAIPFEFYNDKQWNQEKVKGVRRNLCCMIFFGRLIPLAIFLVCALILAFGPNIILNLGPNLFY